MPNKELVDVILRGRRFSEIMSADNKQRVIRSFFLSPGQNDGHTEVRASYDARPTLETWRLRRAAIAAVLAKAEGLGPVTAGMAAALDPEVKMLRDWSEAFWRCWHALEAQHGTLSAADAACARRALVDWDAFCGGLSVSVALSDAAGAGLVTDANPALVSLYQAVAGGAEQDPTPLATRLLGDADDAGVLRVPVGDLTDDQISRLNDELHAELRSRDMLASDLCVVDNALRTLEMACDPEPPADQYPRTPQQVEVAKWALENQDALASAAAALSQDEEQEDEDA